MPDTSRKERRRASCLKERCLRAVREHFAAVGTDAVLDLPAPLIKDLLPHLTLCQLIELQPALNQRGISTRSGWVGVLLDMCGPNNAVDLHTEEEAKHKVMKLLFTAVFYGFTNDFIKQNITSSNTPSFLWAAARCVRKFSLFNLLKPLQALTAEQRPFLNLLENCITSVGVSQCIDLSKRESQTPLYVLHRLLDHGVAKGLDVHVQCPIMLAWLLYGRGSQFINPELKSLMQSKKTSCRSQPPASADETRAETRTSGDQEDQATPRKRSKWDSVSVEEEGSGNFTVEPQALCQMFSPCGGTSAGSCPWGRIERLEISQCGSDCVRVLTAALPTFFCLRSLTLHSFWTFRDADAMGVAEALRQLSDSSRSSLADLSVSILPYPELMEILLDASPNITSLHVEIQTLTYGPRLSPRHYRTAESRVSELPLKKLTVKVAGLQTDRQFITPVLRRAPRLAAFHAEGVRLPTGSSQSQLLAALSESNRSLTSLTLEDVKLSDCLPEVLNLLSSCKLEDLRLIDCRLLEKGSDKEERLRQLVAALRTVASLRTLSLAQNRLAKNVCVLAELFGGCSASSVRRLDISSNFIQPAELLEFAKRLRTRRPPHSLTLDLRKNPGVRDPDLWNAAVEELRPVCDLLLEGWTSTNTMADHISNM